MAFAEINSNETDPDHIIVIDTLWNEKPLLEMVPGAHYVKGKWRAPLTWAAVVTLRGVLGPAFTYGPLLTEWLWTERRNRVDPAVFVRNKIEWPPEWPETVCPEFDKRLRPFQRVGAFWLLLTQDGVLGDDLGTGKTVQLLAALKALGENGLPALVICPNGVKRHWEREIGIWYPEATPYVIAGTAAVRTKIFAAAKKDPMAVIVINIEATRLFSRLAPYGSVKLKRCIECDKYHGDPNLKPSQCEVHPKVLNSYGFKVVILDEAHHIQKPKSKWTRAVWAVMHNPSIKYHWGATGTVIGSHPGDLWSVMHAVNRAEYPVKSKWIDRYALISNSPGGGTDIIGLRPDTRDELYAYFDPRYRRMVQARVLPQLPPKVRTARTVEMTSTQARMYKDLDEKLMTRTDEGQLFLSPDSLIVTIRLMQLAAATVHIEKPDENEISSWEITLKEPAPKLDEMERVLEEMGDAQCVIGAEHKQLVYLASDRLSKLGIRHGFITGDQTESERDQYLQMLREHRIRVLLFTLKAGSEGIDMSVAPNLILLQRSWRMINDVQAVGRVYRFGSVQHSLVNIVDIVTEGTVEIEQIARLYQKSERLEEIQRDRAQLMAAGLNTEQLDQEYNQIAYSDLTPIPLDATYNWV